MQWYGSKKSERKGDPLLQYMFHARNDNEHGIEEVVEYVPGYTAIGVAKPEYSTNICINELTIANGQIISADIKSDDEKPVLIEVHSPTVALIIVKDIGKNKYSPPTTHMGQLIKDTSPKNIASFYVSYLSDMVKEAEYLVQLYPISHPPGASS